MGLKQAVHAHLEKTPASPGPRVVQTGIMALIILNLAAVALETVSTEVDGKWAPLGERYALQFHALEWFSVAVFTIEYLLRVWSVTADPRFARPFLGRLRYMATPLALVDLLAILPSFFQVGGFRAARALRLMRLFRVFKLGHYSRAMRSLAGVVRRKRAELGITVFLVGVLLVLASTLMYHIENEAQPDKFSSIPATMWWGIITLTTVGYGDIFPVTPAGKVLGGVVAMFGIGLVALPAAILASAFLEELAGPRDPPRCPHCGKEP